MIIFYADNYLDRHPEVALQLENNPGLIDDLNYVKNHPGLHWFMQKYPVKAVDGFRRIYSSSAPARSNSAHPSTANLASQAESGSPWCFMQAGLKGGSPLTVGVLFHL